jgi:hypothetical protein
VLVLAARAAINAAPVSAAAAVEVDAALEMVVAMERVVAAQVDVAPENVAAAEMAAATKTSAAFKIAAAAVMVAAPAHAAAAARRVNMQATAMRRVPIFVFAAAARLLPTIRRLKKVAATVAKVRAFVVQLVLRAVVVDAPPLPICSLRMMTKCRFAYMSYNCLFGKMTAEEPSLISKYFTLCPCVQELIYLVVLSANPLRHEYIKTHSLTSITLPSVMQDLSSHEFTF